MMDNKAGGSGVEEGAGGAVMGGAIEGRERGEWENGMNGELAVERCGNL